MDRKCQHRNSVHAAVRQFIKIKFLEKVVFMKKFLSIFLSAVIVLTGILSIPLFTSATVTVNWTKTNVFSSPSISTATTTANCGDKSIWLAPDENCDASISVAHNNISSSNICTNSFIKSDATTTFSALSQPILAYNNKDTSIENFEWDFFTCGVGGNKKTITNFFLFHVNDASDYGYIADYKGDGSFTVNGESASLLSNIHNVFAVVYVRDASATVDSSLVANALNVLQPKYDDQTGASLGLEVVGSVSFSSTLTQNAKYVNIKLEENQLTVSVAQTAAAVPGFTDTESSGSGTFILSDEALAKCPSGDFAVSGTAETSTSNKNIVYYGQMNVTELSVDEAYYNSNPMFDSTGLTDGAWLNASSASYDETEEAIHFSGKTVTDPILESNGYTKTDLTDFVWEFEYKPDEDVLEGHNATFLFHADEDRETNPSVLSSSRGSVRYTMGVTIAGNKEGYITQGDYWPGIIRADMATTSYKPAYSYKTSDPEYGATVTTSTDETTGETTTTVTTRDKPISYTTIKSVNADGEVVEELISTFYTVRMKMSGDTLTVEIWQTDNKELTYTTFVCTYSSSNMSLAPSGDFAILEGDASGKAYIKNMKIYDGTEAFESAEDYSEYEGFETAYTFDDITSLEEAGIEADINYGKDGGAVGSAVITDGALVLVSPESRSTSVVLNGFDMGNDNLGNFIAKFDITDDAHNWNHDRFRFRVQDSRNYYAVAINEYGGHNATNTTYDTNKYAKIRILKRVNDKDTVLAEASISLGLIQNRTMTVKVSAIGNEIKVYYGPEGVVYNDPVLSCTDDTYTSGKLEYYHLKEQMILDNIYIYDLTAASYNAQLIASGFPTADSVTRSNFAQAQSFVEANSEMHEVQLAKLTALSKALDLEYTAVDINGDKNICDILDLVILNGLKETAAEAAYDPVADGVYDINDDIYIRTNYILK